MKRIPNPCYKCDKRSTGDVRCHAKCPRYKVWAYSEQVFREEVARQRKEENDYIKYMARASELIHNGGRNGKED